MSNADKYSPLLKEAAVAEYGKGESTLEEIASRYGVSRASLHRWTQKYKVATRPRGNRRKYPEQAIVAAKREYEQGNITLRALAKKYGFNSASALLYCMNREENK